MISLALLIAQGVFLLLLYGFIFWVARIMLAELREQVPLRTRPMQPGSGRLVVLEGKRPSRGEQFILSSEVISLGRDPANELVVADPFASGQHARILIAEGSYWLDDLGSRNGTLINGKRVSKTVPLTPGDRIEIGDTVFRFEEVK